LIWKYADLDRIGQVKYFCDGDGGYYNSKASKVVFILNINFVVTIRP